MQSIINFFHSVPVGFWAFLAGSGIVSGGLQLIKHYFSLQQDKVITTVLGVLSFVIVVVDNFLSATKANPSLLGVRTASIVGGASLFYRYALKPFYNLLLDARALRATTATNVTNVTIPESHIAQADVAAADAGF